MSQLADDRSVVQRILDHIDGHSTDLAPTSWREPVANYRSAERLTAEIAGVLQRSAVPFCPSAALPEPGAYLAREAAGTPLLVVRGSDGAVRGFRNACRHRGMQLASGSGCERAFVCRYHGWTYGLDGALRHVPHDHGFPGLERERRGLVPVETVERHGLVFVRQQPGAAGDALLDQFVSPIGPAHRLIDSSVREVAANWKIVAEGFLEGYHIRHTHRDTFYPIQYDNLNVVEAFGRHSRIAFPYRRIEKQRALPPRERSAEGMLTYVYNLFPNVMIATFPTNIVMVVLEPLTLERTRLVNYTLSMAAAADPAASGQVASARDFVDRGAREDREVTEAIQRSLGSGANEFFEFGRFEAAPAHFHRSLQAALEDCS